jgi:putative membrane protein
MTEPYNMHSMCGGGWMSIWWILMIVVIVGAISFFFRKEHFSREKTALEILKERYAHGEINKQEFEEMKRDIL